MSNSLDPDQAPLGFDTCKQIKWLLAARRVKCPIHLIARETIVNNKKFQPPSSHCIGINAHILSTKSRGYWDIKKSKNYNPNLSHK